MSMCRMNSDDISLTLPLMIFKDEESDKDKNTACISSVSEQN